MSNTHSEQRHLLVELELNDSVTLAPTRYRHPRRSSTAQQSPVDREARRRRRASTEEAVYVDNDAFGLHPYPVHDANDGDDVPSPARANSQRPYSATRSSSARSLAVHEQSMARSQSQSGYAAYQDSAPVRQAQQTRAKKLSSWYKLKQTVLSSRYSQEPISVSSGVTPHSRRSSGRHAAPGDSPLVLISSALRQNMQLRDQLLTQLRHGMASSSSRHQPATLQPHFAKMLNKLRGLSLSIVEMQVYFQNEVVAGQITESAASIVHLEREFQTYSLKMIASDSDFLSCFSPLIHIFDQNDVSLSRNPFLDGLSLDSSELLLCSCNQVSSASYHSASMYATTTSSSTASSSSLFQLLVHKLEAFAIYMRKNVPPWQILPPERIAAALLHLAKLENRSNAARLLPSYLKPATAPAHRTPDWTSPSSPPAQHHRAPYLFGKPHEVSEIDCFDDEQDELEAYPRPSFEAWSVVDPAKYLPQVHPASDAALSRGKQTAATLDSAYLVKNNRMPPVASVAGTDMPAVAEFKEHRALPVSAKKRKGTCSSPIGVVEVMLDKGQEKTSEAARTDTPGLVQSGTKLADCVRIVGEEAMEPSLDESEAGCVTFQEVDPYVSIYKSEKAAETIPSSRRSTESSPGTSRLNNQSAITEPRSSIEHEQVPVSLHSPDASEIPPRNLTREAAPSPLDSDKAFNSEFACTEQIIRCRIGARKILKRWRAWRAKLAALEKAKVRQERVAMMYRKACARKNQRCWRRWQQMLRIWREVDERRRTEQIESIRRRAFVRKIQRWWRQVLLHKELQQAMKEAALHQQQAEMERRRQQAELMRAQYCTRKTQRKWRRWHIEVNERRQAAQKSALEYLEAETVKLVQVEWMRRRTCARKIQREWRTWRVALEKSRLVAEQLTRDIILVREESSGAGKAIGRQRRKRVEKLLSSLPLDASWQKQQDFVKQTLCAVMPARERSSVFSVSGEYPLLRDTSWFIDVDEMNLPNFCMVTRKMGRIRSMHKRKRLQPERPTVARAHSLTSSQQEFEKLTIFDAVEIASVDDARFLLANGADLAALEPSTGRIEVCGYLHEKLGSIADPDDRVLHVPDLSERSPLHIVSEKGFVECANQILGAASDETTKWLLSLRDRAGRPPLQVAIIHGHLDLITLFLKQDDLSANYCDHLQRFPVHLAVDAIHALSGRFAVIQVLLDLGANPSVRNSDWELSAHVATSYGHFECVRVLLDAQKQSQSISSDDDVLILEAELEQQQASGKSYYCYKVPSPTASMVRSSMAPPSSGDASNKVEYWDELHQEVQLVEESGNFSSEDEGFLDHGDYEEDEGF
ncbi:hypothetical protein FI667_g13028, partial [Globisporangium splendens]